MKRDAEVFGEIAGVVDRALRRELRRHRDAGHVLGAECFDCDRSRHRRIDSAGQSDHDVFETAFANVVAHAEDEGLSDFFGLFEREHRIARRAGKLDECRVLFECARAENRPPLRVDDDR